MRRRTFLAGILAGSADPRLALAQRRSGPLPVIGFLHSLTHQAVAKRVPAFHQGLREAGYDDGRDFKIEYRWAEGRYDRLPGLARELVDRQVSVIVAGSTVAAVAAKAATSQLPIVFAGVGGDPVKLGLVSSFNRPGGNVTGFTILTATLGTKRLEILTEMAPAASTIGALVNPSNPNSEVTLRELPKAAATLGRKLVFSPVRSAADVSPALQALVDQKVEALLVDADPSFMTYLKQISSLAAKHACPAIFEFRDFPDAGGLMSYGPNNNDTYRQAGGYVARILRGESPADLPVQAPTRYEMIINLRTARAIGITVPPMLLARADEVIE